ncbi:MAG: aldo/keto reductase, partial [Parasporobacterium sp.]|nr:aldo/keto reductase [Parasporobacterium sp.]
MSKMILGKTGLEVEKNGFGALPIQRVSKEEAVHLLRKAYDAGINFYDSAHAYTDSEEKIGLGLSDVRENIVIATKALPTNPADVKAQLEQSLRMMKTDYIDVYQLHLCPVCYRPGDEYGLYDTLLEAKEKGLIRHIGMTAHSINVAFEAARSGLYETIQFPFSYLSGELELQLV